MEDKLVERTPDGKQHVFDKPRNVRIVLRSLYTVCAFVFLLDIINLIPFAGGAGHLRHAEASWEGFPGFYAIYGFVACVILVLVAKQLRKVLMRDEDYYDR